MCAVSKLHAYAVFEEFPNGTVVDVLNVVHQGIGLIERGIDRLVGIVKTGVLIVNLMLLLLLTRKKCR